MRFTTTLGWLLAGATFTSAATSPTKATSATSSPGASPSPGALTSCSLASGDTQVLQFSWALSEFISEFYASMPVNENVASQLQNSSSASKALSNLQGLEKQNNLSIEAIQQLSSKAPNFKQPKCSFTIPKADSIPAFATFAYQFESTVSGGFIGLAGYTQSPEVSFLLARLAAEHSAHATWIGSRVNSSMFSPSSNSLVDAYSPTQILQSKNQTGSLGQYLNGCVTAPKSPCGSIQIGPLDATVTASATGSSGTSKRRF
ncbi:hypothetical protein N7474_002302 [Penicillium riverlandense]|uniref:uncharacterized protein n=1 Tax=Penicillium riverlandense TaxID=1903569 RepID=UPI0025471E96|nr:uncharacterized protein N7474_002302 [Penicillium riverlandense]KAJ5825164.1 hypothetical protein N7474_002302 [Penicillium riverlandense]